MLASLCAACACDAPAEPEPPNQVNSAPNAAEAAYHAAKARYETNAADNATAWQFACACFDRADAAATGTARAAAANEGIQVCRRLLAKAPELAAAHYYLAMNLGQLARTKSLGALSLVKEMEREWEAARALDEHFDFAGADRNLGLLYRDAPGFPFSIGSRAQAERRLRRAVELNPEYPENQINLIETRLKHKQWAEAAAEDEKLLATLPSARTNLSGPRWQEAWKDWDKRQQEIRDKLQSHASKPVGHPLGG